MITFAFPREPVSAPNSGSGQRLKVLVLDEFLPFPPDAGKAIRTFNLLKPLAKRHSIDILCHGDENDPQIALGKEKLESIGIKVHFAGALPNLAGAKLYGHLLSNCFSPLPYSVAKHATARFAAKLTSLMQQEHFDLVHCEWTPYASYMLSTHRLPFVIDAHNVETLIWKRRSQNAQNPAAKLFFAHQALKMRRFERRAFAASKCVASVSAIESSAISQWGAHRAEVVHNGVDLDSFPASYAERTNEFLFLGSLDWFPNQDAVSYLVHRLVPEIRKKRPDATFRVVGRRPSVQLRRELEMIGGVQLSADVDDVRPFLRAAAALVVPLRIGGGTRIKILEAMASGCPVVSTSIGCEGLEVCNDHDILVCDRDEEFAESCARLLDHRQLGVRLGQAGRNLVEQSYSWKSAAVKLDAIWQSVAVPVRAERHA